MGVKSLYPYIRVRAPACIRDVSYHDLRGRRIAIDGNLLLFREFTSPWLPVDAPHKAIIWSLRLARLSKELDLKPIVVFDSPQTTPAKARERARRRLQVEKARASLKIESERSARLLKLQDAIASLDALPLADQVSAKRQANLIRYALHGRSEDSRSEITIADPLVSIDGDSGRTEESVQAPRAIARTILQQLTQLSHQHDPNDTLELGILLKVLDEDSEELPVAELEALQLSTRDLVTRLTRRTSFPTWRDVETASNVLTRLGVPVQISPDGYEGECTAAHLYHQGLVGIIATEDSDVLCFDAPQLRGFMGIGSTKSNTISEQVESEAAAADQAVRQIALAKLTQVNPGHLRSALGLSKTAMVDFAILAGTDFTKSIPALGIRSAHKLMVQHGSIECMLEKLPDMTYRRTLSNGRAALQRQRYVPHDAFPDDALCARNIFTTFPDNGSLSPQLQRLLSDNATRPAPSRSAEDKLSSTEAEQLEAAREAVLASATTELSIAEVDGAVEQIEASLKSAPAVGPSPSPYYTGGGEVDLLTASSRL